MQNYIYLIMFKKIVILLIRNILQKKKNEKCYSALLNFRREPNF